MQTGLHSRMFNTFSHPLDRLYSATMIGIGILSSAVILIALYVLTSSLDRQLEEGGNEMLSLALNEQTTSLIASVEAYAFADVLHVAISKRSEPALTAHLRAAQDGDSAFDWIAILSSEGDVIYDLNLPKDWDAAAYLSSDIYRPVLDQIAQSPQSARTSTGGAFEWNGVRFMAAATRITPDSFAGVDTSALPFFIAGQNLDADALAEMIANFNINSISFSEDAAKRSVAVQGPLGFVGNLTWEANLPGSQFRKSAWPWVLVICSILILITSWMAAYFRNMVTSLERLHKAARIDHLTGVANRAALSEVLEQPSVQDALGSGGFAAINLDLDGFKRLNDEHGHHAGDKALRVAAERITYSMQGCEKVFRMGGDEFLCLILDPVPEEAAQKVVQHLKDAFSAPMDLGGFHQVVTPSIGVAIANHGETWDAILERSDVAMYRAKRRKPALSCA